MNPILFNTVMTRAILDGRKTQTRRIVKNNPEECTSKVVNGVCKICDDKGSFYLPDDYIRARSPYQVGNILYVRETWSVDNHNWLYRADFSDTDLEKLKNIMRWGPSIHMPKKIARIFLRVTDVRIERLQDMTFDDFLAEGIVLRPEAFNDPDNAYLQAKSEYSRVWNSTIKKSDLNKYGWDANPWVFVDEFKVISKEEAYGAENRT